MVQFLDGSDYLNMWRINGGEQTLASYEGYDVEMMEDARWLSSLPTMIETENHVFVHAGMSPRHPINA